MAGKPADAVNHALDVVFAGTVPDLVISGINEGQNLGPIVDISGTVGAARTASRQGIPSVAVSQGLPPEGAEPDYEAGVDAVLEWLEDNRDALEDGLVVNINVPTCATAATIRGTVEVPTATEHRHRQPGAGRRLHVDAGGPADRHRRLQRRLRRRQRTRPRLSIEGTACRA